MSLLNSPDPAVRAAVVQQDLGNVLHPIVQHKALETKQMVVTRSEGSTIVDADGTEYLDGMAGLWCVNIGYGRSELAEVAADQMRQLSYFPHTAMNAPAAALAEKINELMGGGYHTYFVNSGSEANEAGFKIARLGRISVNSTPRTIGIGTRPASRSPAKTRSTSVPANSASRRSAAITPITARRSPRWMPAAWASARQSSSRIPAILRMCRRPIAIAAHSA